MELPRDGQEYAHILFDTLPTGATVEASTDNRTSWTATQAGGGPLERLFLLRGPTSTATQGHLVTADSTLWVRLVDMPETVVRDAGTIYLA